MAIQVMEGVVNFSNLTKTDTYMGQDTGKYNITMTMDEEDANRLSSLGVKVKDYQGAKQRKFSSKFDITVLDAEGNPYRGEVPYNSKVRIKFKTGPEHPVHGVSTYLEAVKVLEEAEAPEASNEF